MNLPTTQQTQELLDSFRVPPHIRRHMELVKCISLFLAKKLNKTGANYDLKLLAAAAELHDLTKAFDFQELQVATKADIIPQNDNSQEDLEFWFNKKKEFNTDWHGASAAEVLHQYPELAEVIDQHGIIKSFPQNLTKEAILLNYADKRVNHDQMVSLSERFAYLQKRYNIDPQETFLPYQELEHQIFTKINLKPEDLKRAIENEHHV